MGLFGMKDVMKDLGGWENAMTEEEIAAMEKQGYDMSSVKGVRATAEAEDAAAEEAFLQRRKDTAVATDLNRLTTYRGTPRSTESAFFQDVAGKPPLFGKDKWSAKFATAPLIYCAVVQANSNLWLPGSHANCPAVLVFALDSAHMYDAAWLKATAAKISEMKNSADVPADCKEFVNVLRDDQSCFCFPLGASLAEGAQAWCATYTFERQEILPGKRLPEDGIVPFLLETQPKKQMLVQLRAIPGTYYQG